MTVHSTNQQADHRHHLGAGKYLCSSRKLRDPGHRAAARALHCAVAARTLSPGSCRRERRIYDCGQCAGWHLTSKVAR